MPARNISRVKLNLKNKIEEISKERTERAIYAIVTQGSTVASLLTPVDTANLINSKFVTILPGGTGAKMTGRAGYSAEYAKWVHDAPGTLKGQPRAHFGKTREGVAFGGGTEKGTYWSPNAEPKFLEKGFEQIKPHIPAILKAVYGS